MRNGAFLQQQQTLGTTPLIQGLLNPGQVALMAAPPGEGKSLLADSLAYAIAYEAQTAGFQCSPGNIMIVDSENPTLRERLIRIRNGFEGDGYTKIGEIEIQHYSGFYLDDDKTWTDIEYQCKDIDPTLIILDHLACFHTQNENDATCMTRVHEKIDKLRSLHCQHGRRSILALHHFIKNEGSFLKRLRGSSAILANSHAAFEVRTLLKENGSLKMFGVIPQSRKNITPPAFRVEILEGADWLKLEHRGIYLPVSDPKIDMIAHMIYETFLQDQDEKTVMDVSGLMAGMASDHDIRQALWVLHKEKGLLVGTRQGKGGKWIYRLPVPPLPCPWCLARRNGQTP